MFRFVMESLPTVQKRLETERKGLESDVKDLEKKYHYLETTFVKAQENLDRILKGPGR
jgi:prefoldin subunit 1